MLGAASGEFLFRVIVMVFVIAAIGLGSGSMFDRRRRARGEPMLVDRCVVPRLVFMVGWVLAVALGLALAVPVGSVALVAIVVVLMFVSLVAAEAPLRRHERACRDER